MKLFYKFVIIALIVLIQIPCFADLHKASLVVPIDAKNNAQMHNNLGNIYFKEKDYYAAIKEYRIAIGINPDAQTTASYFNNLGKVYLFLGDIQLKNKVPINPGENFARMAQTSFEEAILKDCMKFEYYENLIKAYELNGVLESKKQYFLANKDKNPFNIIPAAIILKKQGDKDQANMLLDDFVSENPNIIITKDLKKFMKR